MQTTVNTMKQASHYLLLCILISLALTSCHKDIEEQGETTTTDITQVDVQELTQGDVAGYIYDESGAPMVDVDVNILGGSTKTNQYGVYVFRNIDLDKNGTYVRANKTGFILGSDMIYPDEAEVNYSYIKMMQLTNTTTVNGANGGNVVVQGGGIISFPANSIVNADGEAYSGLVSVTAKRIAADDPDLSDVMPGGLVAMDKDGFTRVLGTLGMVAVELRDANGNELNLADGIQASIQFPIVESQQAAAPDQIPLWSFDESQGLWIEEGFATREGNNYVGEVSHFSFWNCDAPFPLVHVCGTVLNTDGTPAQNISVGVMADAIWGTGYGVTDSDGRFCGKMPKGKELTITIYYPGCQDGFTFTVGPFDTDTELDPITLDNVNNGLITGTVFCDGVPVPDASVVVIINQETLVYLADENGDYTFNTSIFGCEAIEGGSIFAFNNSTNEASSSQTLDVTIDASIDFNTCGGCDMSLNTSAGYVDDPCDGDSYFATVDVIDANGMVSYTWSNGSITQTINNLENNLYCVTVTDAEGCEEVSCIEFEFFTLQDSLIVQNSSCDMESGTIQSNPFGGTEPYEYEIFNGFGDVISTTAETNDLSSGSYTVLVTDANGCTSVNNVTVSVWSGIPEFEFVESCGVTQLVLNSQTSNVTISLDGVETLNNVWVYETGYYCFELTDVNTGCMDVRCIDVNVIEENIFGVEIQCDFPSYSLEWGTEVFTIFYSSLETNNTMTAQFVSSISISPLEFGYSGLLVLENDFQMCNYEEVISLPTFAGLNATGNAPSCANCEDGFIDIAIDNTADCLSCILGEVAIYDKENDPLLENDLSNINNGQEMPAGTYYVIVTDADSGCIIAHREITL